MDESNRLADLVNDLLDLSKLESGTQALKPEVFCLTGDIRETLRRYDKLADYSFPFTFDREVFVCADRLRISQVVYNLVNNAINYAGADKTVSLRQVAANGVVRVEIRDTGEGIPADKLPYIWDRYYKVDKDHRRAQVGTGLGLIVKISSICTAGATASRAWWGRAAPSGSSCRSTRPRRPRRRRTEPHGIARGKRRVALLLRGKMPLYRSARRSCGRPAAVRKADLPRRAAFCAPAAAQARFDRKHRRDS